jgi:hypothetical protein
MGTGLYSIPLFLRVLCGESFRSLATSVLRSDCDQTGVRERDRPRRFGSISLAGA